MCQDEATDKDAALVGKELSEGLPRENSWGPRWQESPCKDILLPSPLLLYLQHMLVVFSMQHGRNCCQGNTRLNLRGHERICKLKEKKDCVQHAIISEFV